MTRSPFERALEKSFAATTMALCAAVPVGLIVAAVALRSQDWVISAVVSLAAVVMTPCCAMLAHLGWSIWRDQ